MTAAPSPQPQAQPQAQAFLVDTQLREAAQALLDECDSKHETQEVPHRFGVPYGALNRLRAALAGRFIASQPQAQGLTDELIRSLAIDALPTANPFDTLYSFTDTQLHQFARAIERALRASTAAAPSPVPAAARALTPRFPGVPGGGEDGAL